MQPQCRGCSMRPRHGGASWGLGCMHLQATIRRLVQSRYLPESYQSFEKLCQKADSNLLSTIISNPANVLHQLLPPVKTVSYSLCLRFHIIIILRQALYLVKDLSHGCFT